MNTSHTICNPITPDDLVNCLYYTRTKGNRFNIRPYIHESGIINKDNIQKILAFLPIEASASARFQQEDLIGRYYVTLKEALLEINPDIIERGGPVSESSFSAEDDRVYRGFLLFNSWINNSDVRGSNSKSYLLKDFSEDTENTINGWNYVEEQSDIGKSLSGVFSSGNPNRLQIGHDFLFTDSRHLHFKYFTLQIPKAWFRTTYADLLWMGKKIVKITKEDLQEILAYTHWPQFYQDAMIYKIQMRRNLLAQYLGISDLININERNVTAPSLSIPLCNEQSLADTATNMQLPFELLKKTYNESILVKNAKREGKCYEDSVLINGRVNDSSRSILVRLLRQYRHPSGLDRRISRYPFLNRLNPQNRLHDIPWDLL
ncbi:MAG: hypothetical protein HQK51_17850 [Oligoflexia bacterium]|nr:hypothetical protein [Oligoflexia bacterium]